jgi:hypothetical protein
MQLGIIDEYNSKQSFIAAKEKGMSAIYPP